MKIICDKCNKEFEPTQSMLLEHHLAGGIIEVFFLCPNCKSKHHVCWHNSETKSLQKLIKRSENAGDNDKAKEYRERLKYCLDSLNNRL